MLALEAAPGGRGTKRARIGSAATPRAQLEAIEAAAERPGARDLRAKGAHAARQIVV